MIRVMLVFIGAVALVVATCAGVGTWICRRQLKKDDKLGDGFMVDDK